MGNSATSCAPIITNNGVIKVLKWDGKLQIFTRTVHAAELMVDHPGHFVCDATSLRVSHRIPGLLADDELEPRHLYFLLPMDMLYSVLTHEEISHLNYRASKALKPGSFNNLGKIFPSIGEFCMFPAPVKRAPEVGVPAGEEGETARSDSSRRSWRPALETIVEAT